LRSGARLHDWSSREIQDRLRGARSLPGKIARDLEDSFKLGDWPKAIERFGKGWDDAVEKVLERIRGGWQSMSDMFGSGKGNAPGGANSAKRIDEANERAQRSKGSFQ